MLGNKGYTQTMRQSKPVSRRSATEETAFFNCELALFHYKLGSYCAWFSTVLIRVY